MGFACTFMHVSFSLSSTDKFCMMFVLTCLSMPYNCKYVLCVEKTIISGHRVFSDVSKA